MVPESELRRTDSVLSSVNDLFTSLPTRYFQARCSSANANDDILMWRMFSKSVRPVILLTNDTPLGIPGEVVSVKPGYARNFLIPKGHAVWHTWENKEKFANLVDEEEMAKIKAERAVEDFKKQLGKLTLSFHREVFSLNKEAVKDVISKDYVVTML